MRSSKRTHASHFPCTTLGLGRIAVVAAIVTIARREVDAISARETLADRQFPHNAEFDLEEMSPRVTKASAKNHVFDVCRRGERDVRTVFMDRSQLSEFSLECHGIQVVDETLPSDGASRWNAAKVIRTLTLLGSTEGLENAAKLHGKVGADTRKEGSSSSRPNIIDKATDKSQCPSKMHIWQHVRDMLLDKLPRCWRKKGYTSISPKYSGACERHMTEEDCTAVQSGGCQWNPIEDIWLLHEAKFEKYGSTINRLLTGNLNKHSDMKSEIDEHSVFYRVGGLSRSDMKTVLKYKGYDKDMLWLRKMLDKSPADRDDQVESAFVNHQMGRNDCGVNLYGPSSHNSAFPSIHNDLIVDGMKHFYDWAMGDPLEPSRKLRRRWKMKKAEKESVDPAASEAEMYFVEMGNYWTPLDPYPIAINPLGWRVDTIDGLPWGSGGRVDVQAVPQMCAKQSGESMNLAYGALENQGLLFLTRYLQHSSLPIMDVQSLYGHPERNCRHSLEFRFVLMASSPRQVYSEPKTYAGTWLDFQNDMTLPHCLTGEVGQVSSMLRNGGEDVATHANIVDSGEDGLAADASTAPEPPPLEEGSQEELDQERLADSHGADGIKNVGICFGN